MTYRVASPNRFTLSPFPMWERWLLYPLGIGRGPYRMSTAQVSSHRNWSKYSHIARHWFASVQSLTLESDYALASEKLQSFGFVIFKKRL
jgi:hypothetical protein